ncbi:MAG: hypothetical protein QM658_03055 [Gordonia sp. (in: high G+C Gram-positive bacteria)]
MTESLRDEATRLELELRKALARVRFVIELNPGQAAVDEATALFSAVVAGSIDAERAVKRFPSLTLVALVGHAITSYRDYWETFWDAVGTDRDADMEIVLRHSLEDLLQRCGLDPVSDLIEKHQYVMALATHAGIPVQSVEGLLSTLEDYARAGHDLEAVSFIEWLTDAKVEHRLNSLDIPVQAFIAHGETLAVNVIDRIIDVARFTLEHPDEWRQLPLDTATTGVPDLVLRQVLDRLADRPFLSDGGAGSAAAVARPPKLRYSVEDNQIVVDLPYPHDEPHVPWQVSVAKATVDVVSQRGWGVQDGQHPPTPAPVTEVAPEIGVAHEPSDIRHRFDVFTSEDPFVLFAEDGRWIKPQGTLPRGKVLALIPNDATILDSETDREINSCEATFSPIGWRGWRFHTLDLLDHDGLYICRAGSKKRVVHTTPHGSAEFILEGAVAGIRTVTGRTVYSSRPTVEFPASAGSDPVVWKVSTRRVGAVEWTECDWDADVDETTWIDPFDGIAAPLLGDYQVRVQRGAERTDNTLFLAEGLEVDYGDLRVPDSGGLTDCVVALVTDTGLTASPGFIQLGAQERGKQIRLSDGERTFAAIVRPPCAELRVDRVGRPADWRVTPAALTIKDFEERRVVAVRVPNAARTEFRLHAADGELTWAQVAKQKSADVFSVSSEQFVDTLTNLGEGTVTAVVTDDAGKQFSVTVCHVSAVKRVEAVSIVDGRLVFEELADIEDPAAWVWSMTAPWTPVRKVDIRDGAAGLPAELVDAGGVIVDVFSDDIFSTPTEPTRPGPASVVADQHGWVRDEDAVLDGLAAYLAGNGALPSIDSARVEVWAALKILPHGTGNQYQLRSGLLKLLGRDPRAALEALGSSSLDEAERVSMLVETGLVEKSFAAAFTLNPLHLNPWVGSLVEIADLPSLRERADEVPEERAETMAYLEKQGGSPLIDLLRVGKLADPRTGTFDQYVPMYDKMTPAQLDQVVEASRLVPAGMLEPDTRVKVLLDDFGKRGKWSRTPEREVLNVGPLYKKIKWKHPSVADLILARNEALESVDTGEYPWATLPMISLTLAVAARLAAHRMMDQLITAQIRHAWKAMATMFPGLVATDLLIAEAAVSFAKYGDLIGDAR